MQLRTSDKHTLSAPTLTTAGGDYIDTIKYKLH